MLLLWQTLVLHIKRFKYDSMWSSKLANHVAFPLDDLDMRRVLEPFALHRRLIVVSPSFF